MNIGSMLKIVVRLPGEASFGHGVLTEMENVSISEQYLLKM